jgi:hypothetical protein
MSNNRNKPAWKHAFDFLSGFKLATVLLLLLMVLTWLGTLEQVERGLYATLKKYFSSESFIVIPELNGKTLPLILPGTYWVSALLFLNLLLGGIVRARKGVRTVGVLIAHSGILFLLFGAFITHHKSVRGNMAVSEGESSNVAKSYHDWAIEVAEIEDGKPATVHVIGHEHIEGLESLPTRTFRLPKLPFDLEVSGFRQHCQAMPAGERAPDDGQPVVDGYWLLEMEPEKAAEQNLAGCYAKVVPRDGGGIQPFILAAASYHPFTARVGDRVFTVTMRKKLWKMPFTVRLEDFTAEFHPGTRKPAKFESVITRLEDGREEEILIEMNDPMRHQGLTFFQASWGPQGAAPGTPLFSVFEVVRNPADKWPEYSLYVVTAGMGLHFILKLAFFLIASTRRESDVPTN